jgi:epoxide hydrolase
MCELVDWRRSRFGVRLHFVHERGRGPAPLPLVLTHGWPSTFYELLDLVSPLTDPAAHGGDPADPAHAGAAIG